MTDKEFVNGLWPNILKSAHELLQDDNFAPQIFFITHNGREHNVTMIDGLGEAIMQSEETRDRGKIFTTQAWFLLNRDRRPGVLVAVMLLSDAYYTKEQLTEEQREAAKKNPNLFPPGVKPPSENELRGEAIMMNINYADGTGEIKRQPYQRGKPGEITLVDDPDFMFKPDVIAGRFADLFPEMPRSRN